MNRQWHRQFISTIVLLPGVFAISATAQDQPKNDLKSLFEDTVEVEAAKSTDQRQKLQRAVSSAGGSKLTELVEDGETGFYQAKFGDLTLMFTLDYVAESLSIQSEVQIKGRMGESALRRINRWNQELGVARAFIVESGDFGSGPSTTWMLSDDRKIGFKTPPAAINAFVRRFLKTAKLFQRYATGRRKEPAKLDEISGSERGYLVKFKAQHGLDSIAFPAAPSSWVETLGTPQGDIPEHYWQFRDSARGILFTAIYYDCPAEIIEQMGRKRVVTLVSQQIANNYQAAVDQLKELSGGEDAVGSEFVLQRGSNAGFAKARVYMVKNRLYRFLVIGNKTIQADTATRFFESFKIGGQ